MGPTKEHFDVGEGVIATRWEIAADPLLRPRARYIQQAVLRRNDDMQRTCVLICVYCCVVGSFREKSLVFVVPHK